MEPLFIYLLKSSGLIALFLLSYHMLLRKETFFISNRWFLLSGLVTAVVLPLLVYTKVVWVEPVATTIDWSTIPASPVIKQKTFMDYVPLIMASIYGIGMLVLAIKFLYDFYSLRRLLKGKSVHFQADYKWVDTKENLAPFSFFKTIVYNSALYSPTELENILEHEKVHSDQNHTLDVLIARVFCIVFWFNPFVWFYKKAVLQNLEFIADSEALKKISDKKAYQITLLKITTQENCVAITNHFYQSLIKKRIVMLNQNQSNKRNSWKYFTVLPALIAFMFLFQIETVAQEKVKEKTTSLQLNQDETTNIKVNQINGSVKKLEKSLLSDANNEDIDANTEIYIDGKKVSKEELDSTNPDAIATMNVSKINDKSTIKIITKKNTDTNLSTYNPDETTDLNLEKLDPTNLNGTKVSKTTRTVKIIKRESNGIPDDTEVYIDGKRVSSLEAETMDPTLISTMNVSKSGDTNKNSIHITSKKYQNNGTMQQLPVPPTPPIPPTFNVKPPKAPKFPKAPKAPKGDPKTGDKKEWATFEKKMEEFEKQMEDIKPEMEEFDKKMAEFDKQMEPFNAKMEVFEKKMKIYEKQMEEYQAKLKANK